MAFIPEYEYDIFISYAHVDNIAFPGQAVGWIEQFYKNLNLMLAKRFGRMDMVKIWWDDKKLDGSVLFNDSIEGGIKKAAIMISLTSPGYLQSEYCKQELDIFYKKTLNEKVGLKIGDRSRIINVLLNNIPFSEWPIELSGTSGFSFHNATESDEFGDTVEADSIEFKNQMHHLREAIWHLLTEFHTHISSDYMAEEPAKTELDDDAFTIYLGEVADTLRTPRKRIIAELEKNGFNVITGIPPPDEVLAHEQKTKESLHLADLSIHLLDEYTGREIVGATNQWYPQKQTEIGLKLAKSQMIWVPAEMEFENIEEEAYKKFLTELNSGKAADKAYDFIRGSKSTVAQEIIDFATQLKTQKSQNNLVRERLSVLLDTHYNDQLYAMDLSKALLENQIQPFINPQEDDPHKNLNLLKDRICQVRKLIFLYGNVSKEWVLERVSAALQLIIANNYSIDDFFIYLAPPFKDPADLVVKQKFLKLNIIDSSKNQIIDAGVMKRFLHDLKTVET